MSETTTERMRIAQAILLGGLVGGACDLTYACLFAAFRGVAVGRVPQAVASGLLGPVSFQLGLTSMVLGVLLHFLIALGFAFIYCLASRRFAILRRRALLCGLGYGLAIYYFMNLVVLPLSRAPHFKASALATITGLMVHMFLIGLPIALFARRFQSEEGATGGRL